DNLKQVGSMRFDFDGDYRIVSRLVLRELEKWKRLFLAFDYAHRRSRGREVCRGAKRRIRDDMSKLRPPLESNLLVPKFACQLRYCELKRDSDRFSESFRVSDLRKLLQSSSTYENSSRGLKDAKRDVGEVHPCFTAVNECLVQELNVDLRMMFE